MYLLRKVKKVIEEMLEEGALKLPSDGEKEIRRTLEKGGFPGGLLLCRLYYWKM